MAKGRKKLSASDTRTIRQRIEIARKYSEQTFKARDERHAKLYKGEYITDLPVSLTDVVVLNYIKRQVKLKVAGLAAHPPILRFRPRGGGTLPFETREAMAEVWAAYMPYLWREAEIHAHAKASLRDRFQFGRGWVAIDWLTETEDILYEGGRPEELPAEHIRYDNPIVRRVSPSKLHLDPEVDTLTWEQAGYIVWEMSWSLQRLDRWAKSDSRVNKSVASRVHGAEILDRKYIPAEEYRAQDDKDLKRATIWRYHEHDRSLVVYLAKEIEDEPLLSMEMPYEMEGYPFEPIWGDPVADKLDAIGTVEDLRHWQHLLTLVRSKQAGMIRTAKHIIGVQGAKEEDIQALETSEDRVILPIDIGAQMPREANTTGFPPELMQFENPMRVDLTELSGVTANRRGLTDPGVGTATEASLLQSQASVGERDDQADWEDFNRRIARKAKMLLEQYGDTERFAAVSSEAAKGLKSVSDMQGKSLVRVTPGERFTWAGFTPQDIVDEHEIEVLAGSMGVREEAVERAQFVEGMKAVVSVAQAGQFLQAVGVNPLEVAKEIFRRTGNTDTERFFQPPQAMPTASAGPNGQPGGPPKDLAAILQSVIGAATPDGGATGGIPSGTP